MAFEATKAIETHGEAQEAPAAWMVQPILK
jgi:hypothetical protein